MRRRIIFNVVLKVKKARLMSLKQPASFLGTANTMGLEYNEVFNLICNENSSGASHREELYMNKEFLKGRLQQPTLK